MNHSITMKNRCRSFVFLLMTASLLTGGYAWADAPATADTKIKKSKRCLFPKSKKRAPDWVCNSRADGLAVAAVGSAAKSGAGLAFMEQMAAADARSHLAQNLRGSGQKNTAGGDASNGKITDESLQGTKVVKSAWGPDGTLYVLVGLDEAGVEKLR